MKIFILSVFILFTQVNYAQNPRLVKDIYPGTTGGNPAEIVRINTFVNGANDVVIFNADDDDADTDKGLFRTDGTAAGTYKLNLADTGYTTVGNGSGFSSTSASKLTLLGNKVFFAGDNLATYGEIWVTDGTQNGTRIIDQVLPPSSTRKAILDMAVRGTELLYFVRTTGNRFLLKKTSGTPGISSQVYDFGIFADLNSDIALSTTINGLVYFIVYNSATGIDQLWKTDGTNAGTVLVKDFTAARYVASNLMRAGNDFYIMLVEPGVGNVLWKSDGTTNGTVSLKTIGTSGNNNYPANVAIGNTLYFAGLDGTSGMELWKTDGTVAGTVLTADINPGVASSTPNWLTVYNNQVYFAATHASTGRELWKFNGSAASLVKDLNSGTGSSDPSFIAQNSNGMVFSARPDNNVGQELWASNQARTAFDVVADVYPGASSSNPSIITAITINSNVYFVANNGTSGVELFVYDNTIAAASKKLYVNDASLAGDVYTTGAGSNQAIGSMAAPFASLDYALTRAIAGDTIFVDAGTYAQVPAQVFVTKPVTILGPNQTISPNDATNPLLISASRVAEASITGGKFQITTSNVAIRGFTFNSGTDTAIITRNDTATYNNLSFTNNRFLVGGTSAISITGRTNANPANNILNVLHNRFEKTDTLFGTTIFSSGFNNVNISNNSHVINGGMPLRQSALFIVGPSIGSARAYQYNNNYGDGVRIGFGLGNNFNTGIITNNYFTNTSVGIQVSSAVAQNVSTTITGNSILNFVDAGILFTRTSGANAGTNTTTITGNELTYNPTGRNTAVSRIINIIHSNTVTGGSMVCSNNKISISGNFSTIPTTSIAGIEIYPGAAITNLNNNEVAFTATNAGTILADSTPTLFPSGILVRTDGNNAGMAANGILNVMNNAISGFKQSMSFFDFASTGIGTNSNTGYGYLSGGAVVNINSNSFTGDSMAINNGNMSQIVNANCNWYGTTNSALVLQKVTPFTVRNFPFLGNGTDASTAIGFQPVGGSCASINNFLPAEGAAGAVVGIKGFGFTGTTGIKFNGTPATIFSVANDSTLLATVPVGAATGTLLVTTPAASVTSANNFTLVAPLTADTISLCPNSNAVLITNITGSNYQWQLVTDTGNINVVNGANFAGATSDTLRLLNVPAAWNNQKFRCLVNSSSPSRVLTIKVANFWTGSGANSDWNNPLNWGCSGQTPNPNTNVMINSGTQVIITSESTANSVTASPGSTVTVAAGGSLIIKK